MADSAASHALALAAAEPLLRFPGCLGSAIGVIEIHLRDGRLHVLCRREIMGWGPNCLEAWIVRLPIFRLARFDSAFGVLLASSHFPIARSTARRDSPLSDFGIETAMPNILPSAWGNPA